MKAKVMTAILATIMLTMTACGTISPPIQNAVTKTTATTTAESIHDSAASSEAESSLEDEKIKTDTFIAEFFRFKYMLCRYKRIGNRSNERQSSFENEIDNSNGVNKITLKGSNGGGMIDVLCIDLSQSDLDNDMEYILENFGDYYFGQTSAQMSGITEDDFVSSYRMTSSVVSKGKYQQYGSVQKSDGMATQFGYTETYAVLSENKLTVVSGAFLSSDMMERQSFFTADG